MQNNREIAPFEHYRALYAKLDPAEASACCGVRYDPAADRFRVRLLYVDYELTWPDFSIHSADETGFALNSVPAQVLLMRYLLEGKRSVGAGFLPFRELPWGDVYLQPFTNRCLRRAASIFGNDLHAFETAMASSPALKLRQGDAAYQLEIVPGYDMRVIVWAGDDEFPPNCQMLFSDNFPQSFTAEDRVVIADLLIADIRRRMAVTRIDPPATAAEPAAR